VLAVLLFLGTNFRTNLTFLTVQADCVAALFACIGLALWSKRGERLQASLLIARLPWPISALRRGEFRQTNAQSSSIGDSRSIDFGALAS
jgi:hypothetical protein